TRQDGAAQGALAQAGQLRVRRRVPRKDRQGPHRRRVAMGATFVITLREAFEASLLLGIVYGYLDRIGARTSFHWVPLGGVLGLGASLAMGLAVGALSGPLLELGPDMIGAAVMFVAVGLLTWHAWWMRQHAV